MTIDTNVKKVINYHKSKLDAIDLLRLSGQNGGWEFSFTNIINVQKIDQEVKINKLLFQREFEDALLSYNGMKLPVLDLAKNNSNENEKLILRFIIDATTNLFSTSVPPSASNLHHSRLMFEKHEQLDNHIYVKFGLLVLLNFESIFTDSEMTQLTEVVSEKSYNDIKEYQWE